MSKYKIAVNGEIVYTMATTPRAAFFKVLNRYIKLFGKATITDIQEVKK